MDIITSGILKKATKSFGVISSDNYFSYFERKPRRRKLLQKEILLDLNEQLVSHPDSTFLVSVKGDSMEGENIHDGDLIIVDRKQPVYEGRIVVASVNDKPVVKKISFLNSFPILVSANPKYPPIEIEKNDNFEILGAVTSVIKSI